MGKITILGIQFESLTRKAIFSVIETALKGKSKLTVAKINTEFLSRAESDKNFAELLNRFSLKIVDGKGVQWAAKYLSLPLIKIPILKTFNAIINMIVTGIFLVLWPRYFNKPLSGHFPGVEALEGMLNLAEKNKVPVFFFGASQKDLQNSVKKIKIKFPKIEVAGFVNGYDWQSDTKIDIVKTINDTNAKLLIVALGSPLQENWIIENIDKLNKVQVAVGEGGSLAFIGGSFKRAPKIINQLGLEWLWRLFMNKSLTHQTGNRAKRVWNAVPNFIYKVVKWKIKNG